MSKYSKFKCGGLKHAKADIAKAGRKQAFSGHFTTVV